VPPHVVVVEDSVLVTDALRVLLESAGYRVSIAAGVGDALRLPLDAAPDLMLLDLSLSDGDGLEILTELRARGLEPRTTFALTGYDDAATKARSLAAGCAGVLVKPVPARDIVKLAQAATK
jgi:DNA-binding response OmpR family regulator